MIKSPLTPIFDPRIRKGTIVVGVTPGEPDNDPPVACFTYDDIWLYVNFDAGCSTDADGTIVSWFWDFDDASTSSSGPTVNHIYAASGSYDVTLTVTDNDGATDMFTDTVVVTDFDPDVWTGQTAPSTDYADVAWSPTLGLLAAVRSSAAGDSIITSPDGATWTAQLTGAEPFSAVCWSPALGMFCAVSNTTGVTTAMIRTSTDGITWTSQNLPVNSLALNDVCWADGLGLFVAVGGGKSVATANNVATSPDGVTWTLQTTTSTTQVGVGWSEDLGLLVAVRNNSVCYTSSNGTAWSSQTIGGSNWRDVQWSPDLGLFAACGGLTNSIRTSPDGVTWTSRTVPTDATQWRRMVWAPETGLFHVVGFSGAAPYVTSPDGITWTSHTIGAGQHSAIAWAPEIAMFVVTLFGSSTIKTNP